ncbi:alkaline phosphatase D family protein [Arhodomonas aquaeolei]|uniref:alkaline phosphatase D family protein n=1 Tax=Arhodomonas aquaeolei TaxID=2369 RepID=UPI00035DE249|nr:alkaline phosphatase D family protein [Arhodomonas aquaeolei]
MNSPEDTAATAVEAGPILFVRDFHSARLHLTALAVIPADRGAPTLTGGDDEVTPETLMHRDGRAVLAYRFSLPARADTGYRFGGTWYDVNAALDGDIRLAYVSCNGQEAGDRARELGERNRLWQRLARAHAERPFQLLLHGGDQLYADEMLDEHPALTAWADGRRGSLAPGEGEAVTEALRAFLFTRYLEIFSHSGPARLMARVPSLAMWDDHDICDGWGSLPAAMLDDPVGRRVFAVAREMFLCFQLGTTDAALPPICRDPAGDTLTWALTLPGLRLIAPDLRSERRPDRVMGEPGWAAFRGALADTGDDRVMVLSSVPALGPRLSWVEALLHLVPRMQKYEDDLRDQWQSRAHREEWRRFLGALVAASERGGTPVTVLSGEIHLATRATLDTATGSLHQLVASGIAHPPPPRTYAAALGALARTGEAPLPDHPIRLHPLPGRRGIYTAERNYLVLERLAGRWRAWWELENQGPTPALALS